MPKNIKEKELDTFEQAMEYRIANLSKAIIARTGHGSYTKGERSGFEYALTIYRECRRNGTS